MLSATQLLWSSVVLSFLMMPAFAQCPMAKISEPLSNDLDDFGLAVALQGDLAAITERGQFADGKVHLLARTGSGYWTEITVVQASDGYDGQEFGNGVALDGDVVVVGAELDDQAGFDKGAAYVFVRDDGGTPSNLLDDTFCEVDKLTAVGATLADRFGHHVTVSGGTVAIGCLDGASADDACYVFERNDQGNSDPTDDTWDPTAYLPPDGLSTLTDFGQSVALSDDGNLLLVGDSRDNTLGPGAIHSFHRNDNGTPGQRLDDTWTAGNKIQIAVHPEPDSIIGKSMALEGDWVFAGAEGAGANYGGRVYTFQRNDAGTPSNPVDDTWTFHQTLKGSIVGSYTQGFGLDMDIEGDYALIAAPRFGFIPFTGGSAFLFERFGTTWTETGHLRAPDQQVRDFFGYSVALDGGRALIGARGSEFIDDWAPSTGAAYEFDVTRETPWENLGHGFQGYPYASLSGWGCLDPGSNTELRIYDGRDFMPAILVAGASALNAPYMGDTLVPFPDFVRFLPATAAWGHLQLAGPWAPLPMGTEVFFQFWVFHTHYNPFDWIGTNALKVTQP